MQWIEFPGMRCLAITHRELTCDFDSLDENGMSCTVYSKVHLMRRIKDQKIFRPAKILPMPNNPEQHVMYLEEV